MHTRSQVPNILNVPSPSLWPPGIGGGNRVTDFDDSLMRNLIINGDMGIDQRNAGASITGATKNSYTVDRWRAVWQTSIGASTSIQQVVDAPSGFLNSLKFSVQTGAAPAAGNFNYVGQYIEGLNIIGLGYGGAGSKPITLSFWVKSSLTGNFCGAVKNDNGTRSYVFTYTIAVAATWTKIVVNVPGDITGTWITTNSTGLILLFDLGSGSSEESASNIWAAGDFTRSSGTVILVSTSAATIQFTGVQIVVTSLNPTLDSTFEFLSYEIKLALCQRYYWKSFMQNVKPAQNVGSGTGEQFAVCGIVGALNYGLIPIYFPVCMRTTPGTVIMYNPAVANAQMRNESVNVDGSATFSNSPTDRGLQILATGAIGWAVGNILGIHATADAEL